MGKTRKCRLSDKEIEKHEIAVKLRKKTDEQLIEALQEEYKRGFDLGLNKRPASEGKIFISDHAKKRFLALLKVTPGIGDAIYKKIEKVVIQEDAGGE